MAAAKAKTTAGKLTKQAAPSKPTTRKAGSKAPVKTSAGKAGSKAPAKKTAATKVATAKAPAKKTAATKVATAKAPVKVEKPISTKAVPRQPVSSKAKRGQAKPAQAKPAKAERAKSPHAKAEPTRTASRALKPTVKAPIKAVPPVPKTTTRAATRAPANSTVTAARTKREPEIASELPKPKFNKDGIGYTKDFELAFVKEQHDALLAERIRLTGQANRLESEAKQMIDEAEMGDVQFDDEGGEGDTMVVERERDLALSAQAREAVVEIDEALARVFAGTYGYSIMSGRPLPKERLEAIPWASISVEEKVGGIGRR